MEKNLDAIVEAVSSLSALEVSELVKKFEEKFGVSAAAPMMMAAPAGDGQDSAAKAEQTSFDVILKETGGKKLELIKVIRTLTGGSLQESKAMAEKAGGTIKAGVDKKEAEDIKKKLEDAGAVVQLQ